MKKLWSKSELQNARGCYSEEQIEKLWNGGRGETVTLVEIMESDTSIKDKRWFLFNKGQLTLDQKKALALITAWVVLPIFETKYPDDKRVRECLEGIEKFNKGEISSDELWRLRRDAAAAAAYAYAAAAYAYAAADAAYAAYAAYAADAADAADAAYAAYAADAAYATDAADAKLTYSQRLQVALIEFINTND